MTSTSTSWFGVGAIPAQAVDGGGAVFLPAIVLLRYGVVGLMGYLLLFAVASRAMLARIRRLIGVGERLAAFGIAMFVGTYFVFFVIIMPELVTPGLIFIFLVALRGTPMRRSSRWSV
jgi:O-antigen ligase